MVVKKCGVLWGYTVAVVGVGIADLLVNVAFAYLSIFSVVSTMEKSVAGLPSVEEDLPSGGDDANLPCCSIAVWG